MKKRNYLWSCLLGGIAIAAEGTAIYYLIKALKNRINFADRYAAYYSLLNQVLENKKEQVDMSKYFQDHAINKIAIYGRGSLGNLFYDEIKDKNCEIVCFIDKNAGNIYFDGDDKIPVVGINEKDIIQQAEIIVVTPVFDYDEISEDLFNKGIHGDMISLEDVVYYNE